MRCTLFVLVMVILLAAGVVGGLAGRPCSAPVWPFAGEEDLPGWAIPLIVAVVIVVAAAIYFLTRRREEE